MWDEVLTSLSSRQDTVSPTDTACSSESPAFLGPSSSHLLLYDQNSSEEELEVINGSAGDMGSCAIDIGSVSGVSSRVGAGLGVAVIDPHADDDDDDEDEDDAAEEIVEDEEEEDEDYVVSSAESVTTSTVMGTTAATIIGCSGAMDTSTGHNNSSVGNNSNAIVRGQFMAIGGCDGSEEPLDDFSDELLSLSAAVPSVPLTPPATKVISTGGRRLGSVGSLLEKRKRSLAHNSDDEVRFLLEQQQQQQTQQQHQPQAHTLSHQHHHHHSVRQAHHQQQQHHHHQEELQPEEALLSAPVNFRTSPPLEALKPHRGHILQRSTTPLVLSEGSGAGVTPTGLLLSSGSSLLSSAASSLSSLSGGNGVVGAGASGFYGPGSSTSNVAGSGGHRFGLGRRPIGCDSPLTAVCHRNSTNPSHVGGSSSLGSGLSTTRTSSSSTPSSLSSAPATLARLGSGSGSPGLEPIGGVLEQHHHHHHGGATLVTNMDISRSVSPPAKMFHCAVSPRRRQSRHQQQRLQRPHRPCLDFDKMQQLKARSVTTWRHSNEHSGELSVFCW